jgi:hypothetical protein
MIEIEIQILWLTCFINCFLVCREDKFQCHTRTMGIEHVYVVYDPTTTNRFDLGGRKLVRGIELTNFQVESAAITAANLLAAAARAASNSHPPPSRPSPHP